MKKIIKAESTELEALYFLRGKQYIIFKPVVFFLLASRLGASSGTEACFSKMSHFPWICDCSTGTEVTLNHNYVKYQEGLSFQNEKIFGLSSSFLTLTPRLSCGMAEGWGLSVAAKLCPSICLGSFISFHVVGVKQQRRVAELWMENWTANLTYKK